MTGATGYIGGRLLKALEGREYRVRCLARKPEYLIPKTADGTEVVAGDVLRPATLVPAMRGVSTAYYLVHSMGSAGDFEEEDRRAARHFGEAARAAGVERIVYLGGLSDSEEELSPHLRSRHEVGEILRDFGVQVIEFRASIVIGSGSLSFEMIRALTERLPVMIAPRWVASPAQPIAIEDLVSYLMAAADLRVEGSRTFEIGGSDHVSYGEIMLEYARQRGLKRLIIPVPVLTPRLSSLWLGLITPVYARVGRKLIESLRHPSVVRDPSALQFFPVKPRGIREAIARALGNEDLEYAQTNWSDALSSAGSAPLSSGRQFLGRIVDSRVLRVNAPSGAVFRTVSRLGGRTGWHYANWLWQLRGFLDLLVGGAGLRRGRRDSERLRPGDAVDFWRVEGMEPGRRLTLYSEMKLPGRAWLTFEVEGEGGQSAIRQTAVFDPVGLLGLGYWYALYPLHQLVFAGMLRGIARASLAASDS